MTNRQSQYAHSNKSIFRSGASTYFVLIILFTLSFIILNGCIGSLEKSTQTLPHPGEARTDLALETIYASNGNNEANGDEVLVKEGKEIILRIVFCGFNKQDNTLIYKLYLPKDCQMSIDPPKIDYFDNVYSYQFIKFLSFKEGGRDSIYQFLCNFALKQKFSIDMYVDKGFFAYYSLERIDVPDPYILLKRKVDQKMLDVYNNVEAPPPFGRDIQSVDYEDLYVEIMIYGKGQDDSSNRFYRAKTFLPVGGLSRVILD